MEDSDTDRARKIVFKRCDIISKTDEIRKICHGTSDIRLLNNLDIQLRNALHHFHNDACTEDTCGCPPEKKQKSS